MHNQSNDMTQLLLKKDQICTLVVDRDEEV